MTTLVELETSWSILDVADANDVLDAWHDAEAMLAKNRRKES